MRKHPWTGDPLPSVDELAAAGVIDLSGPRCECGDLLSSHRRQSRAAIALSHRGRMDSVWSRLEFKFPEVKRVGMSVWHARRDGSLRRVLTGDERFAPIRKPYGPETDEEWELLRDAALIAIRPTHNKPPSGAKGN